MDHLSSIILADLLGERYRTLLEVSELIARQVDVDAVLKDLAHELPRVVNVNFVGLSWRSNRSRRAAEHETHDAQFQK